MTCGKQGGKGPGGQLSEKLANDAMVTARSQVAAIRGLLPRIEALLHPGLLHPIAASALPVELASILERLEHLAMNYEGASRCHLIPSVD